jgi:threonine dehydrogenase-like Zn-dependent dehydrogenase
LTGYCRDTGGGWGESLVAHASQLHRVPDELSDEDAVLIEPFACAIHAVLAARLEEGQRVLVLGAGSVGLLTLLAIKRLAPRCRVLVAAKHRHQAELAKAWGADDVVPAGEGVEDTVVDRTGAVRLKTALGPPLVLGGVDAAFDCVASPRSLNQAVLLTRARGSVIVLGMPATLDGIYGAPLVFQETRIIGAYAYGLESFAGRSTRTFALAMEETARKPGILAEMVTGLFPLVAYKDAVHTARATGPTRSIKSVFDLR